MEVVDRIRSEGRVWHLCSPSGQKRDAWGVATAALLRHLAGQTHREIAERLGISATMVTRRVRAHAEQSRDSAYTTRMGRVAMLCVRTAFPGRIQKVRNRS